MSEPIDDVTLIFGRSRAFGFAVWTFVMLGALALMLLEQDAGVPPPAAWAAVILLGLASGLALLPLGRVLRPAPAVTAALIVGTMGLVPLVDPPSEASGFAPWYVRTATVVVVVLIVRARPVAGWSGAALMSAALLGWAALAREPFAGWAVVVARQLATIAAFQVFAVITARASSVISGYRAEQRRRLVQERRREVAARERQASLARLSTLAEPVLTRLAAGEDDAVVREDARRAEAEIRDLLRGRRLTGAPLAAAVRAARARGIAVALLDDLPDDAPEPTAAMRAWAAARLSGAQGGLATVRISQEGPATVLTVTDGAGSFASFEG